MAAMRMRAGARGKAGAAAAAGARGPAPAQAQSEDVSRRALLGVAAGLAAVAGKPAASLAAYGESANVFGKTTNNSGYIEYEGPGYKLLLPSKWNPSKEKVFEGMDLRWEDNADAVTNVEVTITKSDKSSISGYSVDAFVEDMSFMLGTTSGSYASQSEGGFAKNTVAQAAVVDSYISKDKAGNEYLNVETLARAADGNEGGRHNLFKAAVKGGKLYVCKTQAGDKRWSRGTAKECKVLANSFELA